MEIEKQNVSTLGGYITTVLGRLPLEGELVVLEGHGYEALVTKTDGRRVVQVTLTRKSPGPPVPESEELSEAKTEVPRERSVASTSSR